MTQRVKARLLFLFIQLGIYAIDGLCQRHRVDWEPTKPLGTSGEIQDKNFQELTG